MSIVRFATLCDHCRARSPEYMAWPTCRACLTDTCKECAVPGADSEDERNTTLCKTCAIGWQKHEVGCDWLWDIDQLCTCTRLRCNKCRRAMKGTTPYDGACGCGGLIEVGEPKPACQWCEGYNCDCVERMNCDKIGDPGHMLCGKCPETGVPKFVCFGCITDSTESHRKITVSF